MRYLRLAKALRATIALLLTMAISATFASAQNTYTWQPVTNGNWNVAANWLDQLNNSGVPVSAIDTTLAFGGTTNYTATNDLGAFTLNRFNFSGSGTKTIAGAGVLSFGGTTPSINVASGTGAVTVSSAINYTISTTVTNNSTNTLLLGGSQNYAANTIVTYAGSGNINLSPTVQQPSLAFANGSGITYTGNGQLNVGPQGVNAAANSLNTITFANNGTYSFTNGIQGGSSSGNLSMGDNASGGANTTILYNAATGVTLNFANYSSGILSIGNLGNLAGTVNINAGTVRFGIVGGTANTGGDLFGGALTLNVESGATFNFNGNGETMGAISGNGTITGAGITMQLTGNRTWGGTITGTGGFSTGASGVNYTFTGNNSSTGTTTVVAGSSLSLGNGGSSGTVGAAISNAGTLNINRSDAFNFGNLISGAGVVNVTGTGTTTLSALNTYTGATTVSNGTLRVLNRTTGSAYTVNDGAGLIFQNNAIATPFAVTTLTLGTSGATTLGFELNGGLPSGTQFAVNVATNNGLTLNGTTTVNVTSNGTLTSGQYALLKYAGTIQGTGFSSLTLNSGLLPFRVTGSLVNNTANSSIDLSVVSDFIKWRGNVAGSVWDINSTPNFILNSNSTATNYLQGGAGLTDSPVFDDTATSFTVNLPGTVSPNAVTVNNSANNYTFQGAGKISGSTAIVKQGTGTLILLTDNDYSGGTNIQGGAVQLGNDGTIGSVAGTVSGSGALTVNRSDNFTLSNGLTGTVSYQNLGSGTVTLTGTSTTNGTFTFASGVGVTRASAQANLGGASTLAFNGGTLQVTGNIDTSGSGSAATQQVNVSASNGTLDIAPGVLFNKRGDQVIGAGTLNITGGGLLGMGSGGTTTLANLNIQQGGFRLTSQRTGSLGGLTMGNGTTLYLLDTTSFTQTGQFSIAAGATINMNGGDGLTLTGISGNANILGTSTGSGAWLHTLDEAGSANAGINSRINLTGQNRFTMLNVRNGNNVADTVTDTFNQEIAGTGGIVKDGNGRMNIAAASTYSGATVITNGTFGLTGSGSINNTSAITVQQNGVFNVSGLSNYTLGSAAAQTLQGTGNVVGTVTVAANGTLRGDVGTGTGMLTLGNTVIQNAGILQSNLALGGGGAPLASNLNFSTNTATLDLQTGSVLQLTKYGNLSFSELSKTFILASFGTGNGANLLNNGSASADGDIFGEYVQGTGNINSRTVTIDPAMLSLAAGDRLELRREGTNLVLVFTPVPEPMLVLGVAGVLMAGISRWRRRR